MCGDHGDDLLLLLAGGGERTVEQLTAASGLPAAATLGALVCLIERGFVAFSAGPDEVAAYRLNPKGVRTEMPPARERILVIDDDRSLRELMTLVLETAGYAVIAAASPADGETLLRAAAFDLVVTDGFSAASQGTFVNTATVLAAAGAIPIALFTAHRIEPAAARAAGFRDLIEKPFDLDTLER
jgi:CheY-like chemotaxis protein